MIGTLIREYAGKNMLMVTHHLTILSIRANLERLTPDEFIRLDQEEKPVNCGVTVYTGNSTVGKDGKLILDRYNQKLY
jgi:broad specificity phosphatase PhoE